MGVMSRVWQWVAVKALESLPEEVRGVLGVGYREWDELYGKETDRDYGKLVRRYVSWVYACANINAQSIAAVPLRLYAVKNSSKQKFKVPTRKLDAFTKANLAANPGLRFKVDKAMDVEEVLEHPFLDLMQNVNPFMNQFGLIENWVLFQELTGNCYTLIVKNEQLGIPDQLWILPSQHTRIVPSKEFFVQGYLYGRDPNDMQKFEAEEVMHMKYENPRDMFYGTGPLAAAALAVDAHQGMSTHEYQLLRNYAVPPAALSTENQLQDEQVTKLKKDWNAAYRGPMKAGRIAVLQGGLTVKPIALTPREMGYMMGRKLSRDEIAAVFGVPMSLLTVEDIKAAPATGMIVGNATYARRTIRPKCRRMEEKLNERILPMYDPRLFVAFDNPVPEDLEFFLKQRESNLKMGYTTINEERLADNREPVEWGELPLIPNNLAPLGSAVHVPGEDLEEGQPFTEEFEAFSSSSRGRVTATALPAPANKLNMPGSLPRLEATLRVIVQKWYDRYRDYVLDNLPQSRNVAKAGGADFFLPPEGEMMRELAANAEDPMKGLVVTGAKASKSKFGVGMAIELGDIPKNLQLREFINNHTYKFSFSVTKQTHDALSATLEEGLNAGESMFQLRDRVRGTLKDKKRWEAERIARTESARAMGAGAEASWIADETVDAKEWNGASDMCEFCQSMNAQFGPGSGGVPLGKAFVGQGSKVEGVAGGNMSTNYGAIEYPPLHPNCRCDLLPVVHLDAPEPVKPAEPKPTEYSTPTTLDPRLKSEIQELMLGGGVSEIKAAKAAVATNAYSNKFYQICRGRWRGQSPTDHGKLLVKEMNDKLGLVGKQRMSVTRAVDAVEDYIRLKAEGEAFTVGQYGLHRGMAGKAGGRALKVQEGGVLRMQGTTSWAGDVDVALGFTNEKPNPVVVTIKKGSSVRRATKLDYISDFPDEGEVLCGQGLKLKVVKRVEQAELPDLLGGTTRVTQLICEEVRYAK